MLCAAAASAPEGYADRFQSSSGDGRCRSYAAILQCAQGADCAVLSPRGSNDRINRFLELTRDALNKESTVPGFVKSLQKQQRA